MTTRRHRPIRSFAAPLAVVALALGPLSAGLAPSASAAARSVSSSPPITVTMSSVHPLAPQPGDTEVVSGVLRNTSDETLTDVSVQLRMGAAISNRLEFDTYAADPDGPLPDDIVSSSVVGGIARAHDPTLRPGATTTFQASLVIDTDSAIQGLLSTDWEVHPLGIDVYDSTNLTADAPAGQLKTFLSWAPATAPGQRATRVAWVWPLMDRPHRTISGAWADDALAPELAAPSGRLSKLVTAGLHAEQQHSFPRSKVRNVRVTWAIDPMLVGDAASMSAGYKVPDGTTTKTGAGTSAAKTWLAQLRMAVSQPDATVLPVPYGDPDVMAAIRGGLGTLLGAAATNGATLLRTLLSTASLLPDGWPPGGYADQDGLNALTSSGATTILLDGDALPAAEQQTYTPTARTTVATGNGPINVVLTDPVLSDDVQDGANHPGDRGLALQRYLAETLMIEAERPNVARDVVVAPDARWNPERAYADRLLAYTGRVPWISSVSLGQVQQDPLDDSGARRQLTYPRKVRRHELGQDYLEQIKKFRADVNAFTDILQGGPTDAASLTYVRTEQQALSSGWRHDPDQAASRIAAATKVVSAQMSQVKITSVTKSYVTLTSHNGKVPVTISNNLDTPVNIDVKVARNQRLTLSHNGLVPATIGAHLQQTVFIKVGAKTSGVFPLQVQLLTPHGEKYGTPVQLFVRSTAYGTVTLLITGSATAALLIAVAVRLGRRALAARRSSEAVTP